MTALSLIQQHCRVNALNVPTSIIGSQDTTVVQLVAILQEQLDELATQSEYNTTTVEATFTAIAAEDQGAITTLAPSGYQWMITETFFDRTLKRPVYGPLNATEWQEIKALPNPGPFYKFRFRGDHILLNPTPVSPLSNLAFEYVSSWLTIDGSTGARKAAITLDTDTFVFPDNILGKALSYRWKLIKGLPYQADETAFWNLLNNYIAKDKAKPRINLSAPQFGITPGIFVPAGSWNV